jgi:predicted transglutaminase-like cysteine proteinase
MSKAILIPESTQAKNKRRYTENSSITSKKQGLEVNTIRPTKNKPRTQSQTSLTSRVNQMQNEEMKYNENSQDHGQQEVNTEATIDRDT